MTSWHERNCRRPDVLLMDSIPACLSCGSLFLQTDETERELNKHTAVVDKSSSRLNLDWPSSITFCSPEDATDPNLRDTLLALDRYQENDDLQATITEEHSIMPTEVGYSAASSDSQDMREFLTMDDPIDDHCFQKSTKKSDSNPNSKKAEFDSTRPASVYQSLMGSDEIRLLHLDPQENAAQPLHGSLRSAKLSMHPDYIALSYTWADATGDRRLRDHIFLGHAWVPFAITSNCAAALHRLRMRGGTCVLWIDAICIDQTNIGERSHQVSMMRDIYSRARSVSIFLGGDIDKDLDTPARRLLQRLSEDRFYAGKEVTSNWGRQFDIDEVRDLFQQPYWSRIWVIQEVLLARQAEIILGHAASVSLIEFMTNFMSRIARAGNDLIPPWVPQWLYLSGGSLFGDMDSFLNILRKTSTCQSSDDRDMVFALFGLVQGASLEGLVADYSKTTSEIYIGLTAYFLIRHGYAGLLKAAASEASNAAINTRLETPNGVERHPDLPSWVPFATFHRTPFQKPLMTTRFQDGIGRNLVQLSLSTQPGDMVSYQSYHCCMDDVQPTSCNPSHASLTTYKVFGNHGTLLIRAFPVVHMSYTMGSAMLHDAFTFKITTQLGGRTVGLIATGTPTRWGISVSSSIPSTGDDEWIIEVPGCDTFLHLQQSGRVPGTYKIAALSSVTLHTRHTTRHIPPAADSAAGYRLWMPLVSCDLQHLLFLRSWEGFTRKDTLIAPCQPRLEDSPCGLTPQILEKYGQWLELDCPPIIEGSVPNDDFDYVVRIVSMYLERWEDHHLWPRIYRIVVEVPWQNKLQELAEIKADAWHYLATGNRYNGGDGEHCDAIGWQKRLHGLFEDLVGRLPDISLRNNGGEPSLGKFMSMDTCLSLCNSIQNVPECWTIDDIRTNEAEILNGWIGVEFCWDFMNRSGADCRALLAKFDQLRAIRRLCRREQRDFLIC